MAKRILILSHQLLVCL